MLMNAMGSMTANKFVSIQMAPLLAIAMKILVFHWMRKTALVCIAIYVCFFCLANKDFQRLEIIGYRMGGSNYAVHINQLVPLIKMCLSMLHEAHVSQRSFNHATHESNILNSIIS